MIDLKVTDEDRNIVSIKSNHTHNLVIGNTSIGKSYLYQILERSIKIELNGQLIKLDSIIYLMEDRFLGAITPNIFYQSYESLKEVIRELDIKLIVLDDFGIPEISDSIRNLINDYQDICIIYMFRDFTFKLDRITTVKFKINKEHTLITLEE
jgi:DNA replication protein DnaC